MSSTRSPWPRRVGRAAFHLLLALEALTIGLAGLAKFLSPDTWTALFQLFGYPALMSPIVGAAEIIGAGLLLVPRLASWSAIALSVIMLGALQAVLSHETSLGWTAPLLHLVALGIIGAVRWRGRGTRNGRP